MKSLTILLMSALAVSAQTEIRVAANSSSGTYAKMLTEISQVCDNAGLSITPIRNNGGAPGNLDALYNNKADAAFLHSDVYFASAQSDPTYNKLQTLVALYPEPVHVLALRNSMTKVHIFQTQQFNSLGDARGYKVGAAGGGVITAKVLSGQGQGGFTVVPFDTGDQVIQALTGGQIDLAIFVGAEPLPNLEALSGSQYKIIPVNGAIANAVSNVYRPTKITYHSLTGTSIETIAPMATLLSRKYSTPEKIAAQSKLRSCIEDKIGWLQDNGSPSWQSVIAGDHGLPTIPWLDLPTATTINKRGTK